MNLGFQILRSLASYWISNIHTKKTGRHWAGGGAGKTGRHWHIFLPFLCFFNFWRGVRGFWTSIRRLGGRSKIGKNIWRHLWMPLYAHFISQTASARRLSFWQNYAKIHESFIYYLSSAAIDNFFNYWFFYTYPSKLKGHWIMTFVSKGGGGRGSKQYTQCSRYGNDGHG